MLKKSLLLVFVLFLINFAFAEEVNVVSERTILSPLFYIILFSIISIIGLIIFFIKKLNYNFSKILKSIVISLLITLIIEVLFYVVGSWLHWFMVYCSGWGKCPSSFEIFIGYLPYTATTIFLITILTYYLVKFVRRKKRN